jgi:hypothetical protein
MNLSISNFGISITGNNQDKNLKIISQQYRAWSDYKDVLVAPRLCTDVKVCLLNKVAGKDYRIDHFHSMF